MADKTNVHRVVVYRDIAGEWRWRAEAANGEPVADSGEGYTREVDAARAVAAVFGRDVTVMRVTAATPAAAGSGASDGSA